MTKKSLSILLCSLMAVPTLAIGGPARTTPTSATATTAVPHLPDAAFRAGESVSHGVFSTNLERTDADETTVGLAAQSSPGNRGRGFDTFSWGFITASAVYLLASYILASREAAEEE